jgi:hypothetical protein
MALALTATPFNIDLTTQLVLNQPHDWSLETREGDTSVLENTRLLGFGSSHKTMHNHDSVTLPTRERRCNACRWQEIWIFIKPSNEYVVYTLGPSIIPGERTYVRITGMFTGFEVIETVTVRQGDRGKPYLPAPAARALAMAAEYDDLIREAYVNRAVV